MRRLAVVTFLVAVVALGLWKLLPFWSAQTPVVDSTPVVSPVTSYGDVRVRDGETVCVSGVKLSPRSRFLRFLASSIRPAKVRLAIRSDGYRFRGSASPPQQPPLTIPITAPRSEIGDATVCLSVRSRAPLTLLGIPRGRTFSDSDTTVNGTATAVNATLTVLEDPGSSRASSLPATIRHASALSPLPAWMTWVTLVLASAGVLAALALGLGQSAENLPTRRQGNVKESGPDR